MKRRQTLLFAVMAIFMACSGVCLPAWSQSDDDPGGPTALTDDTIKNFSSADTSDIDRVDLSNLKLRLHIPLVSFPQRGKLHLGFYVDYTSQVETNDGDTGIVTIEPDFVVDISSGSAGAGSSVVDSSGSHRLYLSNSSYSITNDGSGYLNGPGRTVIDRNGLIYTAGYAGDNGTLGYGSVVDPNGNTITYTAPGYIPNLPIYTVTDSMGRTLTMPPNGVGFTGGLVPNSSCTGPWPAPLYSWAIPGPNGQTATYNICEPEIWYNPLGGAGGTAAEPSYPDFGSQTIQSIQLPDGRFWRFEYDDLEHAANPSYGDLTKIVMPTGDEVDYTWQTLTLPRACVQANGQQDLVSRGIASRKFGANGIPWTYQYVSVNAPSYASSQNQYTGGAYFNIPNVNTASTVTSHDPIGSTNDTDLGAPYAILVTDPDGNQTLHVMQGIAGTCTYQEIDTEFYKGLMSAGVLVNQKATMYAYDPLQVPDVDRYSALHVWVTDVTDFFSETETDYLTTTVPIQYSSASSTTGFDQVSEKRIYDSDHQILQKIDTSYEWQHNPAYLWYGLMDLPYSVTVSSNSAAESTTQYTYDDPSLLISSGITTQHGIPSGGNTRGNLTEVFRYLNTAGGNITTTTSWYDTGMPYQMTDARGNHAATITYDPTGTYPQSVSNALGQSSSAAYDFNTGQVNSITDPNNQTTHMCYTADGRIQAQLTPDGGGSTYAYSDSTNTVTVSTVISGTNNGSCPGTITPSSGLNGAIMQTQATYDGLGRTTKTTLMGWGESTRVNGFDNFGRSTGTTTYDSANESYVDSSASYDMWGRVLGTTTANYCYDGVPYLSNVNAVFCGAYGGLNTQHGVSHYKDIFDADGNHSQQYTDALGRLLVVLEPDSTNTPSIETDYTYDTLGNLTSITQLGMTGETPRVRTFTYDSLSRLVCSSNPENSTNSCPASATSAMPSGVTTYAYDANGNVTSKTDARGVTINYNPTSSPIDALNRVTEKTYSDNSTPPVFYVYDQSTTNNGFGRLSEEDTGSTSAPITQRKILAYDQMGRITSEQQCVWNSCSMSTPHGLGYTYDQAGNLTAVGNINSIPDSVNPVMEFMTYNSANRLQTVMNNSLWTDNQHPTNLFSPPLSGPMYGPMGILNANIGDHLQFQWTYDYMGRSATETVTTH